MAADKTASTYLYLKEAGPDTNDGRQPVPWNKIPDNWKQYRWDAIDVLYLDPFPVQSDYTFGIGKVPGGDLTIRFLWVVANARLKNPNIRIILMQTSDPGDGLDWTYFCSEDQIVKYASSMADFMKRSQSSVLMADDGTRVSGRIDGFDLDYEYGTPPELTPYTLEEIRSQFNAVKPNPPLYLSITPAYDPNGDPISKLKAGTLDFVNMQRYDGGQGTTGDMYLRAIPGLKPSQLIYGIDAERPWYSVPGYLLETKIEDRTTLDEVLQTADNESKSNGGYGGMFIWRLNSNNDYFENMMQVIVYNRMHKVPVKDPPNLEMVDLGWRHLGGKSGTPPNTAPTAPWNTFNWQT